MKPINRLLSIFAVAALASGFALLAAAKDSSYLQSDLRDGDAWGGTSWTATQENLFGGEPVYQDSSSNTVLVRYSYYCSDYDVKRHIPIWVAHIDTADSSDNSETRTGNAWSRLDFRPDANVVHFSMLKNLPWVKYTDYVNANPQELSPVTAYNKISRGHMASNLEMKGHGDEAEGKLSQTESFSYANALPQMQGFNAPFWAAIEGDCLKLAKMVGTVAVITGGVYQTQDGKPLLQTGKPGGMKVRIPIPTAFFKVVIAKVGDHTTAIAYLVEHRADLKAESRSKYLVPIRAVEDATGINFMPRLGANDAMEKVSQQELVELLAEE